MTDDEFNQALGLCAAFTRERPLVLPPRLYDEFGEECLIRGREIPDTVIASKELPKLKD